MVIYFEMVICFILHIATAVSLGTSGVAGAVVPSLAGAVVPSLAGAPLSTLVEYSPSSLAGASLFLPVMCV